MRVVKFISRKVLIQISFHTSSVVMRRGCARDRCRSSESGTRDAGFRIEAKALGFRVRRCSDAQSRSGMRGFFSLDSHHHYFALSVGFLLYSYGVAYRRVKGLSTVELFNKSSCSPLCGMREQKMEIIPHSGFLE